MSTATDNNPPPNKRTRFSEKEQSLSSNHVTQPPKLLAESFIKASIASLPHPIIATDVEKLGKEHLLLLSKKFHLEKASQRLVNDADVIPQSARFKFELSCSDRVKELPEYKELHDQTTDIVSEMQLQLKKQIIAASKLEIISITAEIQRHLAKSIRLITSAILVLNNDKSNVDAKVYSLVQNYIDNLSAHTPMTLEKFITIYKQVHTIETFPPSNTTNAATSTTTASSTNTTTPTVSPFFAAASSRSTRPATSQENDNDGDAVMINKDIKDIKTIIENVFVSSWTRFAEQQSKNELTVQLKKLSSTFFTTRSTSEAVAVVDAEPAADKKELKALIRLETDANTRTLTKQLEALKKELDKLKSNSKNATSRGQRGASDNKNKSPVSKPKTGTTPKTPPKSSSSKRNTDKNRKRKVGENNNGNGSAKKKSKPKPGTNRSRKNGPSSNNTMNRQRSRSSKK
jgi:hypothetical protein